MKKVFLWLFIVSMITVFSLAGCKEEATIKSKIAFASERDGNLEIYIMDPDGSNQVRLTNNDSADAVPRWSPDGSKIAFQSDRGGNYEIYVMDPDGSNQVRLTDNDSNDGYPSWSPK